MNLSRNTFSLLDIQVPSDLTAEDVLRILRDNEYEDEKGFGFGQTSLENDYLDGTLIKRTPVFVPDFINNRISKREIFIYSEVSFAIDFTNLFLEVHDSAKQVSKVIQALRKVLDGKVAITECKLFPSALIPKLKGKANSLVVNRLIINNFKYEEDIVGKYSARVLNTKKALDLLSEYGHDVVKAEVQIEDKANVYLIEFHSAGRIAVKCEDARFQDILFFFKGVLKNQNNG